MGLNMGVYEEHIKNSEIDVIENGLKEISKLRITKEHMIQDVIDYRKQNNENIYPLTNA